MLASSVAFASWRRAQLRSAQLSSASIEASRWAHQSFKVRCCFASIAFPDVSFAKHLAAKRSAPGQVGLSASTYTVPRRDVHFRSCSIFGMERVKWELDNLIGRVSVGTNATSWCGIRVDLPKLSSLGKTSIAAETPDTSSLDYDPTLYTPICSIGGNAITILIINVPSFYCRLASAKHRKMVHNSHQGCKLTVFCNRSAR
jgi:hypothetical protein